MPRGGKRVGAGRPLGSNAYGEPTIPLRIPQSRIQEIKAYLESDYSFLVPFFTSKVRAGLPTDVDDSIGENINITRHLIKDPKTTFVVNASGDSMIDAGIHDGDMLIVDKSLIAKTQNIIIASIDGSLTVKRLLINKEKIQLKAENQAYPTIEINGNMSFSILGVVTFVIHKTIHTFR